MKFLFLLFLLALGGMGCQGKPIRSASIEWKEFRYRIIYADGTVGRWKQSLYRRRLNFYGVITSTTEMAAHQSKNMYIEIYDVPRRTHAR